MRLIEVKGLAAATGSILFTPNERRVAEDRPDCFWLYVVTHLRQRPATSGAGQRSRAVPVARGHQGRPLLAERERPEAADGGSGRQGELRREERAIKKSIVKSVEFEAWYQCTILQTPSGELEIANFQSESADSVCRIVVGQHYVAQTRVPGSPDGRLRSIKHMRDRESYRQW